MHGRGEKSVQGFGGKTQRKETTWRTRHRWEDRIKMELREIGWGGGVNWTGFDWLRIGTSGELI
jgi:hypothetical protein